MSAISTPTVLWAQRDNCIFLTIELGDPQSPQVTINPRQVQFSAAAGADKRQYSITIDLFDEIKPEESAHAVRPRATEFCLKKVQLKYWPRLCESSGKKHWLKIDFNKWKDEDDEDEEGSKPGPGGFGGGGGGDYDFEEMMKSMGGLGGAGGGANPFGGMGGMGGDKPNFDDLPDDGEEDSDDEANMPDLE